MARPREHRSAICSRAEESWGQTTASTGGRGGTAISYHGRGQAWGQGATRAAGGESEDQGAAREIYVIATHALESVEEAFDALDHCEADEAALAFALAARRLIDARDLCLVIAEGGTTEGGGAG